MHWTIIGVLSLALTVSLIIQKKRSIYGAIVLGLSILLGLLLIDTAFFDRFELERPRSNGLNIKMEFYRLLHGNEIQRLQILLNFLAFLPFGFLLSEYFSSAKRFSTGCRIGYVFMAGFGLSLCIEFLQLVFRLGLFELTDLVMNSLGTIIGALFSFIGRFVFGIYNEKVR